MALQRDRIVQTIVKRENKVGGLTLTDAKASYKAAVDSVVLAKGQTHESRELRRVPRWTC